MLRIFTLVKIQRLRPGLNPQTWMPVASMLITRPPKLSVLTVPTFGREIYKSTIVSENLESKF